MDYPFQSHFKYYKFYKPFGVLSQFTREHEDQACLADYLDLDKDIYPVGRLDKDSEGLLILSNDPQLNAWLLRPQSNKQKTYWAQVENDITEEAFSTLKNGILIRAKGKEHFVNAESVSKLKDPDIPDRIPPIRKRKNIPTSWCEMTISEGKNRQVRRMLAKVGFPVLRLIRIRIEQVNLDGLKPGELLPIGK